MVEEIKVFAVNCHIDKAFVCDMESFEDVCEPNGKLKYVICDFVCSVLSEDIKIVAIFDDLSNVLNTDNLQGEKSLNLPVFVSFGQTDGIKFFLDQKIKPAFFMVKITIVPEENICGCVGCVGLGFRLISVLFFRFEHLELILDDLDLA